MSEMIDIDGTNVSKDTIKEALKKHCGFKEEPKWIAAISDDMGGRLILHIGALSYVAKQALQNTLKEKNSWISFDKYGSCGAYHSQKDGLTFYSNTKIIF